MPAYDATFFDPPAPIERLIETAEDAGQYELEGFHGSRSLASAVRLGYSGAPGVSRGG